MCVYYSSVFLHPIKYIFIYSPRVLSVYLPQVIKAGVRVVTRAVGATAGIEFVLNLLKDFHQILRICLSQEGLEITFQMANGNNCCRGNTFFGFLFCIYKFLCALQSTLLHGQRSCSSSYIEMDSNFPNMSIKGSSSTPEGWGS